ncbi:glycosyltransferase family 9 protein [Alistipes sp.]|uniref:glycosyltransferase family 9 protein n=1 Tax=Alistipes sp. TaxID=1872444 RepID=UPI003AEF29EB
MKAEPYDTGKRLPRHLLVVRNSAMGDVAMLPHALRALTAAYPDLHVTVATQPHFKPFFAGLRVDFLDVDLKGAHHSLAGMLRLAAEARRLGVDAVADVHGVMRSQAFSLSMRLHGIPVARIRKGRAEKSRFIRRGGRGMAPLRPTVLRYCDVFRRLGFVFDDPQPVLPQKRPNPMGEKHGVWVGFAPFSAHAGKTYPEALSREAVALLAERCERVFIHGGGGREAEFAQEMERMHPNVTALYGRVRFAGEMDLVANLDCVVSMDSLVMHLAALVGTPVVSVWGATHPGLGFLGWGCDPANVLQADLPCRPCSVYGSKPCKFGDYRCLWAITPRMIADRVAAVAECRPDRGAE